jgi:YegS/Rv2252/BmrU family lipid kinase
MAIRPHQKKKNLVFLINPGAGQRAAAKVQALAPRHFPAQRYKLSFVELNDWRETYPLALQAAKSNAWAVVAVGGDGTINQVAAALAGTPCRLGIVAAGTGNGFGRALGIPLDAEGACRVLAAGRERRVDHVSMDKGRSFANMLGIGWDAWIAVKANRLRWMNRFSGFLRYLAAAFLCLRRILPQPVLLRMDGRKVQGRFMVVAVGNSPQYGFGCTIAPMARLDDGWLDVVLVPMLAPWTFLRNAFRLFTQKPLLGAQFFRARKVSLHSLAGYPLAIHVDGEPGGLTPATLSVRPRALKVLAP